MVGGEARFREEKLVEKTIVGEEAQGELRPAAFRKRAFCELFAAAALLLGMVTSLVVFSQRLETLHLEETRCRLQKADATGCVVQVLGPPHARKGSYVPSVRSDRALCRGMRDEPVRACYVAYDSGSRMVTFASSKHLSLVLEVQMRPLFVALLLAWLAGGMLMLAWSDLRLQAPAADERTPLLTR